MQQDLKGFETTAEFMAELFRRIRERYGLRFDQQIVNLFPKDWPRPHVVTLRNWKRGKLDVRTLDFLLGLLKLNTAQCLLFPDMVSRMRDFELQYLSSLGKATTQANVVPAKLERKRSRASGPD